MKGLNRQIIRTVSTASSSVDLYPNHTTFLVHFDGTQGATTGFVDNSWNNWTSSQAVSATQNAAFTATTYFQGGSCLDMSYTTNYNVATKYSGINWAVSTGTTATTAGTVCDMSRDFTIEGWIYWVSLPAVGSQAYWISTDSPNNFTYSASVNGMRIGCRDNGECFFYMDNGVDLSTPAQGTAGSVKFTTGKWQHFAVVKQNNYIGNFVDGVASTGSYLVSTGARTQSQGFGFVRTGVDVQKSGGPYYLDEVRITSGVARYSTGTNFTPDSSSRFPLPTDPYRKFVTTHLRFENNTTDSSQTASTWSLLSGTTYSTTRAFGSYSLNTTGANKGIATAATNIVEWGTGDFTVECWFYRAGTSAQGGFIFDSRPYVNGSAGQKKGLVIWNDAGSAQVIVGWQGGGTGYTVLTNSTTNPALATWHHLAYSRNSGSGRFWLNGAQIGSTISDTNNYGFQLNNTNGHSVTVGKPIDNEGNTTDYLLLDEVRITTGVGRYSAAFTPPTAPWPGE